MSYIYILLTILFTVYGQLILKWRLNQLPPVPEGTIQKFFVLFKYIFDPFIFTSFFSAFLASLTWMAALKEVELSKAYPFMSLSYVCVLIFSVIIFHETFSYYKIIGSLLIMVGIIIISQA